MKTFAAGVAAAFAARALMIRALLFKFGSDTKRLNAGDRSTLVKAYAEDAVLHFNEGDHRWSGKWVGRDGVDRFLQNFIAAGIQGEIKLLATTGPPWALTMLVRFDDFADSPDGTRLYENRAVLVVRTRWGKIVDHEDFYVDTARIEAFDRALRELGVEAVARPAQSSAAGSAVAGLAG